MRLRKNRIMSIAIMVIVIVILTNFDKSAGKVVYDSQSISESDKKGKFEITARSIAQKLAGWKGAQAFATAKKFEVRDLWSGKTWENDTGVFEVSELGACDNITIKISPA